MRALVHVVVNALGLWLASTLINGVHFRGQLLMLLVAGVVIGLVNLLVKPIVTLLSLPFIVVTLGLFYLVINGLMFWLAAKLVPGWTVDGCMPAILGGLVLGILNWIVGKLFAGSKD